MRPEIFLIILGMAAVTYFSRITFLVLVGRISLPDTLSHGLRYIPIGILTAMVVPGLLAAEGRLDISFGNQFIIAGLISGLVAARWKNVFLAMGSGMLAVVALRLV
ncbi:MAG: AzlD domain-containing protein [Firmicutes bacterium]|nr:AzlD domain-containing protein [Bacillota bacterium]